MSISSRPDQVILRSELSKFGGQSQLSAAIKILIEDGVLMRMGRPGVFAKAKKTTKGTCDLLCGDVEAVLQEYFHKIHVDAKLVRTERDKNQCKVLVDFPHSRKVEEQFGRYLVIYYHKKHERQNSSLEVPKDIDKLPKKNVGNFIVSLAKAYHIDGRRSKLDAWSEAVTRAAGDDVQLDNVGQLLTRLFKAKIIDGHQMGRLMTNYALEQKARDKAGQKSASASTKNTDMSVC
jgi:superfamily II RNA helicase